MTTGKQSSAISQGRAKKTNGQQPAREIGVDARLVLDVRAVAGLELGLRRRHGCDRGKEREEMGWEVKQRERTEMRERSHRKDRRVSFAGSSFRGRHSRHPWSTAYAGKRFDVLLRPLSISAPMKTSLKKEGSL